MPPQSQSALHFSYWEKKRTESDLNAIFNVDKSGLKNVTGHPSRVAMDSDHKNRTRNTKSVEVGIGSCCQVETDTIISNVLLIDKSVIPEHPIEQHL